MFPYQVGSQYHHILMTLIFSFELVLRESTVPRPKDVEKPVRQPLRVVKEGEKPVRQPLQAVGEVEKRVRQPLRAVGEAEKPARQPL